MKLARLRLTTYIVTLNDDEWPIRYRHHAPEINFSIEVRINGLTGYVYASIVRNGEPDYAGKGDLNSYSEVELFRYVSMEAFNIATTLEVPAHHVWPLIEQFPEFSHCGVKISDAEAFEGPILDLVARGVAPQEVIRSLGISRDLYAFVTCERLQPSTEPVQAPEEMDDGPGPEW